MNSQDNADLLVLISADAEWQAVTAYYQQPLTSTSPYGAFFRENIAGQRVILFQGGWGKVAAAASTQYAIDTWHPSLVINLGTCGGFEGKVKTGEVLLVNETLIYDIYERMENPEQARAHYCTTIDLSFLSQPYPQEVQLSRLISADQDIDPAVIHQLVRDYSAIAADWESGAIAWTAKRNNTRVLILRGVSDLVNVQGGEMYENDDFPGRAREVMHTLLDALPAWIVCANKKTPEG